MKHKRGRHAKERCNTTASLAAEARKKTAFFNLRKKDVITSVTLLMLVAVFAAGSSFIFVLRDSGSNTQINNLNQKIDERAPVINAYHQEFTETRQILWLDETTVENENIINSMDLSVNDIITIEKTAEDDTDMTDEDGDTELTDGELPDEETDAGETIIKETELLSKSKYKKVYGRVEAIDWFHGGSKAFPRGTVATVIDVKTGLSFKVKRLGGKYHADSEPLTKKDTARMFKICNKEWSWTRRAILVKTGGRYIAASMNGMPHKIHRIGGNGFPGHFCIHFLNSKVHQTSEECPRHQKCVMYALLNGNGVIDKIENKDKKSA